MRPFTPKFTSTTRLDVGFYTMRCMQTGWRDSGVMDDFGYIAETDMQKVFDYLMQE